MAMEEAGGSMQMSEINATMAATYLPISRSTHNFIESDVFFAGAKRGFDWSMMTRVERPASLRQYPILPQIYSISRELSCPSLAFQETTLSQRLRRRACELIFEMLSASSQDTREINRAFFNTFRYLTPKQVLVVGTMLSASDRETLDFILNPEAVQ